MNSRRDPSFSCECGMRARRRAGFRYPAQTRVPTRCKRSRWARSRQALLVVYVLQQHSVLPGTIHCCCCSIMCHTNKAEAAKKGLFALTSDLPQYQRTRIMMRPSGHPAARRQTCTHAPIPSRRPRSVFASTLSLSRACYVSACCVLW